MHMKGMMNIADMKPMAITIFMDNMKKTTMENIMTNIKKSIIVSIMEMGLMEVGRLLGMKRIKIMKKKTVILKTLKLKSINSAINHKKKLNLKTKFQKQNTSKLTIKKISIATRVIITKNLKSRYQDLLKLIFLKVRTKQCTKTKNRLSGLVKIMKKYLQGSNKT